MPGVNEINLTRTRGAGALAHEFGHGLDHYFARIADVVGRMGPPPWSKRLIADERQLVTLIASPPGGPTRMS